MGTPELHNVVSLLQKITTMTPPSADPVPSFEGQGESVGIPSSSNSTRVYNPLALPRESPYLLTTFTRAPVVDPSVIID